MAAAVQGAAARYSRPSSLSDLGMTLPREGAPVVGKRLKTTSVSALTAWIRVRRGRIPDFGLLHGLSRALYRALAKDLSLKSRLRL